MKVLWCWSRRQLLSKFLDPEKFDVVFPQTMEEAEFNGLVRDADFLVVRRLPKITKNIITSGKKLKLIQRVGAQLDNIDLSAARDAGISVSFIPMVNDKAVAEHAILLMLALNKNLLTAHDLVRSAAYRKLGKNPVRTSERIYAANWMEMKDLHALYQRTLGLIGFGEMGQAVARRANGLEMNVIYYKRHRLPPEEEENLNVRFSSKEELLRNSDFVSLHAPHTSETEQIIGRRELNMMKPTAFLINTSRGGLIDEAALRDALVNRVIAGAGLDVFVDEPLPEESQLLTAPHVIFTPHSSAVEDEELQVRPICENILRVAKGDKAVNVVNLF